MRIMLGIVWLLLGLVTAQEWSNPVLIYNSTESLYFSTWKQHSANRMHLLISEGYMKKIRFWYTNLEDRKVRLVDEFESDFQLNGGFITGMHDGKQLWTMWSLIDTKTGLARVFARESLDCGATWHPRLEFPTGLADGLSRRRPSALYNEETERLWVFYLREDGTSDTGEVVGLTRPPGSQLFGREFLISPNVRLASPIKTAKVGPQLLLVYHKWLDKEVIASVAVTSRSGMYWTERQMQKDSFKNNLTNFAEELEPDRFFVASTAIVGNNTNKTAAYSYDLGLNWQRTITNVPGYMRSVALTSCKVRADAWILAFYAKERNQVMFSYTWPLRPGVIDGQVPPLPDPTATVESQSIFCTYDQSGTFLTLTTSYPASSLEVCVPE